MPTIPSPTRDRSLNQDAESPQPRREPPANDRLIGMTLDDYRIEGQIGRGGMGTVYAAWDTRNNRPVAIKIFGGAFHNQQLFGRFLREAETIGRLKHPGIVELYQLGQAHDRSYMAMQRIDGMSLRDWLNQLHLLTPDRLNPSPIIPDRPSAGGPDFQTARVDITPSHLGQPFSELTTFAQLESLAILREPSYIIRVAEILRDIATALMHAHLAGVIHRDLKPENLMIQPNGDVMIIDFGLARSFADSTLTTHSAVIGTPLYMAPEQLKGRPAGPQSDIYAVGLIGYELLTHTLPYRAATLETLLGEVLNKPAPPLTARNPAVPVPLANIIHQAMAKKPADRYASIDAFRADLDRFLSRGQVSAGRYRYRFNPRDLVADRPREVSVCGAGIGIWGCFMAIFGLLMLTINWKSFPIVFALSISNLWAGMAIISGRGFPRASTLIVCLLGSAVTIYTLVYLFLIEAGRGQLSVIFICFLIEVALCLRLLRSQKAREWFSRMDEEYQDFRAERASSHSGIQLKLPIERNS